MKENETWPVDFGQSRELTVNETWQQTVVYRENIMTEIEWGSLFILQILCSICLIILHTHVILFLNITNCKI